jgi:uncharacterized protein YkwD
MDAGTSGVATGGDPTSSSTTAMATTMAGTTSTAGDPTEVPANAYCADVADWMPAWSAWEDEVVALVNDVRAMGANCGAEGSFGPAGPLVMEPALRCAARKHSKDMHERMFFDHVNPSGEEPWDRMDQAGYTSYGAAGENIAGGQPSPQDAVEAWLESDGHCANIMGDAYTETGVGYYPSDPPYRHLWTQVFARPR